MPEVDEEYLPTGRYSILCMNPNCFTESKCHDTLEVAIEKWNKRTSISETDADQRWAQQTAQRLGHTPDVWQEIGIANENSREGCLTETCK